MTLHNSDADSSNGLASAARRRTQIQALARDDNSAYSGETSNNQSQQATDSSIAAIKDQIAHQQWQESDFHFSLANKLRDRGFPAEAAVLLDLARSTRRRVQMEFWFCTLALFACIALRFITTNNCGP